MQREQYLKEHGACGIKVGDSVKIIRRAESNEQGWGMVWVHGMNNAVGKIGTVYRDTKGSGFAVRIEGINEDYCYPYHVLKKVATPGITLEKVFDTLRPDLSDCAGINRHWQSALQRFGSKYYHTSIPQELITDPKEIKWLKDHNMWAESSYDGCNVGDKFTSPIGHTLLLVYTNYLREKHDKATCQLVIIDGPNCIGGVWKGAWIDVENYRDITKDEFIKLCGDALWDRMYATRIPIR